MPTKVKVYFCLLLFLLLAQTTGRIFAVDGVEDGETLSTNPKDRAVNVSLTVKDETPPSTPILISPENNSTITDSTPAFIWEESTDNWGMSYYILYLDGSVLFTSIPLSDTSNSNYTLTLSDGEYTLTPSSSISDGSHTWKVVAVDVQGNQKSSDTWTFTIDTAAPTLVITKIAEVTTSISAQDLSTLPDPYLSVTTNEPTLIGTSEASSSIDLTVIIPSQSDLNYTISVDSSGNWSQALPILPRDVIITLNFIVTDSAGNVTVLNDVYFMVVTQYAFSSPTPTLAPGETPSPTATPGSSLELPSIPLIPPKEVVTQILRPLIPETLTESVPEALKTLSEDLAPVSSALISVALPLATTTLLASQFGWGLSLQVLLRILQALGILPPPQPQGLVFNSETEEPVAFALLNITSTENKSTLETVVTNTEGVYGGVELPPGKYVIEVRHEQFTFPTLKARPQYLTMSEFYKGELFEITKQNAKQLFLIPLDPKAGTKTVKGKISWSLIRERFIRVANYFIFPLFLLSLLIALFYPTWANIAVVGIYVILLALRLFKWLKIPTIRGKVVNDTGQPLSNVFVRVFIQESNQLMAVMRTDAKGEFKVSLPKNEYQVSLTKQGHVWIEQGEIQNFYLADARKKTAVILAVMQSSEKVFSELFK